jgi:WD40 repeat protein
LEGFHNPLWRITFIPQNRLVAGSWDHFVRAWELPSGKLDCEVDDGGGQSWWTNAGMLAAHGSMWNVTNGKPLGTIPGGETMCWGATPSGHFIFTDKDSALVDFTLGSTGVMETKTIKLDPPPSSGELSSDGNYFLSRTPAELRIYTTGDWKPAARFAAADRGIKKMNALLRPDGKAVLVIDEQAEKSTGLIWDWRSGAKSRLFEKGWADHAVWSPDGKLVLIADRGTHAIYDGATGQLRGHGSPNVLHTTDGFVNAAFTTDGRLVAAVSRHVAVGPVDGKPQAVFTLEQEGETYSGAIALSPDGHFFAIGVRNGKANTAAVLVYRMPTASAPAEATRVTWRFKGGLFENMCGKKWEERGDGGTFEYIETTRNADYIEMVDTSRGVTIRLRDKSQEDSHGAPGSSFTRFRDGTWER